MYMTMLDNYDNKLPTKLKSYNIHVKYDIYIHTYILLSKPRLQLISSKYYVMHCYLQNVNVQLPKFTTTSTFDNLRMKLYNLSEYFNNIVYLY